MGNESDRTIFSSRVLNFPLDMVYRAFAEEAHLKKWWGPRGFTNTFYDFDLKPGGKWILTMHGPEKGNYENSSVFQIVEPRKLISWKRLSQPIFDMEVGFKEMDHSTTEISFCMRFKSREECEKLKKYVLPKNEENFDRLAEELLLMHN